VTVSPPGTLWSIAIKALEDAGVLAWVNRLVRIRDAEREPFALQQAVTHLIAIPHGSGRWGFWSSESPLENRIQA
jgi:hypothetical protein